MFNTTTRKIKDTRKFLECKPITEEDEAKIFDMHFNKGIGYCRISKILNLIPYQVKNKIGKMSKKLIKCNGNLPPYAHVTANFINPYVVNSFGDFFNNSFANSGNTEQIEKTDEITLFDLDNNDNDVFDRFFSKDDVEQTDDTDELPHSDVKDINFAASALSNSMLSSELTAIDKASKSIIEISKPAMGF